MVKINIRALKALAKTISAEDADSVEFKEVFTDENKTIILAVVRYEDYRGDEWKVTYVVTTEGAYRLD